MGLTNSAVGVRALSSGPEARRGPDTRVVALAGNPNVGKSTVFNSLTGMNQHTGNWPGKTVASARGVCLSSRHVYELVDIPGTYSLLAHSAEEEVARNFLCFGGPDAVVVICDATCLERNLNLVLQTMEITSRVVVCVNLMDEARRRKIRIDLPALSRRLGVPVVGATAGQRGSLDALLAALDAMEDGAPDRPPLRVQYPETVERAAALLEPAVRAAGCKTLSSRWLSLRLLDPDPSLTSEIESFLGADFFRSPALIAAREAAGAFLSQSGVTPEKLKDLTVTALVSQAEALCRGVVFQEGAASYGAADRRIDRVLTSRRAGYPVMLGLLALVFWLTISGANGPSRLLSAGLFRLQGQLDAVLQAAGAPEWLNSMLVQGVYRVLAWVVSVMLPPMAIFFSFFTLLEDAGYLPRIAYNLDHPFHRCQACGKQALTM